MRDWSLFMERVMIRAHWLRIIGVLFVLACTSLCASGAEVWIEVQSPHFTVVSNASVKQARRVAKTLEQFQLVFHAAIPNLRTDPGSPLIVIAARDARSLTAFIPDDRREKDAAQPAGLFLPSPDRNYVLLRADASSDQDYHVIYHEYVHMIMRLNFPSLPLWLREGLAELFGYATITDGLSGLGRVKPEYLEILKRSWIPLPTLMAVTQDSPYYRQRDKSGVFYTESWALAHYLLLGDAQASKQLNELLRLIQNDVAEKEAVEQAFGDLKALERNLERYVRSDNFKYLPVETRLSVNEDIFTAHTLSEAESLAIRGEVLVHTDRLDDAKAMLEKALRLDRRNAHANEGMGFLYMKLEDPDLADKYFLEAAKLDSKRYLAQYYAAFYIYRRSDDYAAAEVYLRKALEINPSFAPACDLLSCVLASQTTRLPEALVLARKAATLEPAELRHRINIGTILANMGRYDEARALAERILPVARTPEEQSNINSLLLLIKNQQERILEAQQREAALQAEQRKLEEQRRKDEAAERKYRAEEASPKQDVAAAPKKTGPTARLKGLVRSVKCSGSATMDIELNSRGKLHKLQADNYYRVQYWAMELKGQSDFQPCRDLQGKQVEVEFLSVSGQAYSGLIKTIAIEK